MDSPSRATGHPPDAPGTGAAPGGRSEAVLVLPLAPIFAPAPDPSAGHPDESAELEGYAVSPDRTVSVAIATSGAESGAFLDDLWRAVQARGYGVRWWVHADDRGRHIAVLTARLPPEDRVSDLLRGSLVLPARVRAGYAELHLRTDPKGSRDLDRALREVGIPPASIASEDPPRPMGVSEMDAEDWAFLGLLQGAGVLDPGEVTRADAVAEIVGIEPRYFEQRVRAVEDRMRSLVSGLFAPPPDAGSAAT